MKRFSAIVVVVALLICSTVPVLACDESQSDVYITQIIFGDDALSKESDENVKMLLSALYLCSQQSDNLGQDKIDYLKGKKVSQVPSISNLNISSDGLIDCSHNTWEHTYTNDTKAQDKRRKVLQNTVNKVFDFGTFNNWFGSSSGQCNSFSAFLYYSHILTDYLADDPTGTEVVYKGRAISSFSGTPYVTINANRPSFTISQKTSTEPFVELSDLDTLERAGVAFANIDLERVLNAGERKDISSIHPSGWNQQVYDGITPELYNRSHLIAHQLLGIDTRYNLITGTRYMNEYGMKPFEDKVATYIRKTGNHVLYRVTPVYEGDNKVASGVQMEAYSVEDKGNPETGICFNVYCYNVQPGIKINYATGESEQSDSLSSSTDSLPFAVRNPSDDTPDLMYEIGKQLEVLFADQKNSVVYGQLIGDLNTIASGARSIASNGSSSSNYLKMKEYEYDYFEKLKIYVPMLLQKEDFFKSAFN